MLVKDPSDASCISSFFSSAAVKFVVPVLNRLVPKTAPFVASAGGLGPVVSAKVVSLLRIDLLASEGFLPALKLSSLVLSSLEKTLLVKLFEPILNENCPSVVLLGKVTLLSAS